MQITELKEGDEKTILGVTFKVVSVRGKRVKLGHGKPAEKPGDPEPVAKSAEKA